MTFDDLDNLARAAGLKQERIRWTVLAIWVDQRERKRDPAKPYDSNQLAAITLKFLLAWGHESSKAKKFAAGNRNGVQRYCRNAPNHLKHAKDCPEVFTNPLYNYPEELRPIMKHISVWYLKPEWWLENHMLPKS